MAQSFSQINSTDQYIDTKNKNTNNLDALNSNSITQETPVSSGMNTDVRIKRRPKPIPFWVQDPNILFKQPYVFEFFPVETMTYEQKLNAVTRSVLVLTIITFLYTHSTRLLAISAVTLLAIIILHFSHTQSLETRLKKQQHINAIEGFVHQNTSDIEANTFDAGDSASAAEFRGGGRGKNDPKMHSLGSKKPSLYIDPNIGETMTIPTLNGPEVFVEPIPQNPMGNVLLTDYDYNPKKKPAPPTYLQPVEDEILKQAKKMVIEANPGQPDIANKLFGDLGDDLEFERSMRPFFSTASTTIPNDQAAFADFCYGTMVSAKEGNMFALNQNNPRYNMY